MVLTAAIRLHRGYSIIRGLTPFCVLKAAPAGGAAAETAS
jgi:hypothetical protein